MTEEQNQMPSTKDKSASTRRYTAEVGQDPALETTTISLFSTDQSDSSLNILVCIAPEYGSNLFRFRAGEHDLIYTDQELLTNRDFTGTFVLWPFPNRVRDRRYTYQGQSYSLENVHRPGGYSNLIHGLVFDRPWHYSQPVIGTDAVSASTYVDVNTDNPYYPAYPFDSRLSLTYTLSGTELTVTYYATQQACALYHRLQNACDAASHLSHKRLHAPGDLYASTAPLLLYRVSNLLDRRHQSTSPGICSK